MVRFKEYLRLLHEIKDSKRNREQFRKVYGDDASDSDIGDIFTRFTSQQSRLGNKDIFGYDSLSDLKEKIYTLAKSKAKRRIEDKEARVLFPSEPFESAEHLYKSDDVLVVKVNTEEESKYYGHEVGQACTWCISYKTGDNAWDSIASNSDFVFVIDYTGDKFAIQTDVNDNVTVWNKEDGRVPIQIISVKYPEIIPTLQKEGIAIKPIEEYEVEDYKGKGLYIPRRGTTVYMTYDYELMDGVRDKHPAFSNGGKKQWIKNGRPWKDTMSFREVGDTGSMVDGSDKTLTEYFPNGVVINYVRDWNGRLEEKNTDMNGERHSIKDEPSHVTYHHDGTPKKEIWHKNGTTHRDGKPAYILHFRDGGLQEEAWWRDGELHRIGGPAGVSFLDGKKIKEQWFIDGKRNRPGNKPSETGWDTRGNLLHRFWADGNISYRAQFFHPDSDVIKREEWSEQPEGMSRNFGRKKGPAIIEKYPDGSIQKKEWWRRGMLLKSLEYYENGNLHKDTDKGHNKSKKGHHKEYQEDGTKRKEQWFSRNKETGGNSLHRERGPSFVDYHENGEVRTKRWHNMGKNVKEEIYFDDGTIRSKGDENETKFFDQDGNITTFIVYDGADESEVTDYYSNGKMRSSSKPFHGQGDRIDLEYNTKEVIVKEEIMDEHGNMLEKSEFDDNGNKLYWADFNDETGALQNIATYYPNKNVKESISVMNDYSIYNSWTKSGKRRGSKRLTDFNDWPSSLLLIRHSFDFL